MGSVVATVDATADHPGLRPLSREVAASDTAIADTSGGSPTPDSKDSADTFDIRVSDSPGTLAKGTEELEDSTPAETSSEGKESTAKKDSNGRQGVARRKNKERTRRENGKKAKAPVLPGVRFRDLPSGESSSAAPK